MNQKILQELPSGLLEFNDEVNDDCEEDDSRQRKGHIHQGHGQGFNERVIHGCFAMAEDDCPL